MAYDVTTIGGADGPTSIFLAGKVGDSWLNVFGLIIVILILLPNIIYEFKVKGQQNRCLNKLMNLLERAKELQKNVLELLAD